MFITKKHYDELNARIVELAKQVSKTNDILLKAEIDKTPSVIVVDNIKEVIRPQN